MSQDTPFHGHASTSLLRIYDATTSVERRSQVQVGIFASSVTADEIDQLAGSMLNTLRCSS
jgi:hypothetical protein